MRISDLFLILIMLTVASLAQNVVYGNVTFLPPPDITDTNLFQISNSSVDGKLIWSPKLEVLNLDAGTLPNGTNSTNVTLTVYNRSAPSYNSQYVIPMPGSWEHVESSIQDLSCSMLIETGSRLMALLTWNRVTSQFQFAGALPLSNFTADAAVLSGTLADAKRLIAEAMTVGTLCEKMTYINPSQNIAAAYRSSPDLSAVHIIVLPTNWNIQAVSYDLNYVIASDKLYSYDRTQFQYVEKYSFANPLGAVYQIRTLGKRVVVWTRATQSTNLTSSLGYYLLVSLVQVYAFHDKTPFKLVGMTNAITHVEQSMTGQSDFSVFTSPQLSKLGLGYYIPAQNMTQVIAKHIDWNSDKWYDLKFSDPTRYFTTVQKIDPLRELDFNDFYLVVRNGTMASNFSDPNKIPYEEVYQMVSNNFTLLRSRNLLLDNNTSPMHNLTRELTTFVKTFIEPSVTTKALVLDVYTVNNSTYQIVQWDYGSLLSTRQVVKQHDPSYINFLQPEYYDMVSSLRIYQWAFFTLDPMNNTVLIVKSVDNSTADHFRTNYYPLSNKIWKLVYQNKNCKVLR